ncbi:MAG: uroporphyrinogen decarboxylase [Pseudomonadota bacterium]
MLNPATPKLLSVLNGNIEAPPPIWMMRQAGRHLPEYLALRDRAKDFLDFCYTPSLASEVTLQPIRRYDMDGAILFADILLILDALGLGVRFEKGIGPIVEMIQSAGDLQRVSIETAVQRLSPVYETASRVQADLDKSKTLIGFCGSPWTVALYAVEGRGGTDKSAARLMAYQQPDEFDAILNLLVEASAHYLAAQVNAGANALMLFESWAEGLPDDLFDRLVVQPNAALVRRLRALGVSVPIIGFPRGAGTVLPRFVSSSGVDAVGLDTAISPDFVNKALPDGFPVQGHLDPLLLIAGGDALDARVRALKAAYADRPHIFNLGHGVRPETPIKHVERVIEIVRETL